MSDRYDISGSPQGQFQPGSNDHVLLNKLGITDPAGMDDTELSLLDELQSGLPEVISDLINKYRPQTFAPGIGSGWDLFTSGRVSLDPLIWKKTVTFLRLLI